MPARLLGSLTSNLLTTCRKSSVASLASSGQVYSLFAIRTRYRRRDPWPLSPGLASNGNERTANAYRTMPQAQASVFRPSYGELMTSSGAA
jgi:hypothetical protein